MRFQNKTEEIEEARRRTTVDLWEWEWMGDFLGQEKKEKTDDLEIENSDREYCYYWFQESDEDEEKRFTLSQE